MSSITGAVDAPCAADLRKPGGLQRLLRTQCLRRLADLRNGLLVITDALGVTHCGSANAELRAHVRIHDASAYEALALRGSVGAAESYMAGAWDCDDLVTLVRILVANRSLLDRLEGGLAQLGAVALKLGRHLRRNTLSGSRRNIAAHYDLGNAFFALFLSPDLMYSSAIWEGPDDTLERASTRKLERICQRLQLGPADHLLEIGSGWGGFAVYAAATRRCRVTTTTISREQHRLVLERVGRAGLGDRVTVLLQDYRELAGAFDKVASIEMIEAIGAEFLPTYFATLTRLLKPGGLALLQAITIEDHRYAQALRAVDFIKQYVFPGSFIPSIHAMLSAKTQVCDLALIELQDFGPSYARTLAAWRRNFLERLDQARAQGFDDRFLRLWNFYLAYCEGGFRERSIGVSHLLFARPGICG